MYSSAVTTSTAMTGSSRMRLGLLGRFLERHGAGDLERHLRAVDLVVRTEGEAGAHVDERVARDDTALHRLLDTGVDRGDVLARDHATLDLVDELVAAAGTGRLEGDARRRRTDRDHRSGGCSGSGPSRPAA